MSTGNDGRNRAKPKGKPRGGGKQQKSGSRGGGGSDRAGRTTEEQEARKLQNTLASVLSRLPDIERKVLEARMGLVDGAPMKPGEVASNLGLTIHEVKTIEVRAFERIREIGPLKGLEKFLGK